MISPISRPRDLKSQITRHSVSTIPLASAASAVGLTTLVGRVEGGLLFLSASSDLAQQKHGPKYVIAVGETFPSASCSSSSKLLVMMSCARMTRRVRGNRMSCCIARVLALATRAFVGYQLPSSWSPAAPLGTFVQGRPGNERGMCTHCTYQIFVQRLSLKVGHRRLRLAKPTTSVEQHARRPAGAARELLEVRTGDGITRALPLPAVAVYCTHRRHPHNAATRSLLTSSTAALVLQKRGVARVGPWGAGPAPLRVGVGTPPVVAPAEALPTGTTPSVSTPDRRGLAPTTKLCFATEASCQGAVVDRVIVGLQNAAAFMYVSYCQDD